MSILSNRQWFQLHGWLSLPIWAVFMFVCLTGAIAVISHELTWLTNPNARAENPHQQDAKPLHEIATLVQRQYPEADISGVAVLEPYLVNVVMFSDSDKPYALAYVNQYTGQIQEVNNGTTFVTFMRSLHGWLLFPWHHNFSIGYYLVSGLSIVVLGALITGMMVYKRFWRGFLNPKLRLRQGGRTALADLHRIGGIWSLWFMLLMGLTGLWYLVQAVLWHSDIEIEPYPRLLPASVLPQSTATESPQPSYTLANALSAAQQRFDNFQPSYVMMPEHHRDTYKLSGHGGSIWFDHYSYNLAMDPWTGDITQQFSPDTMTPLQTLMHLADPLHFGYIGGLWTKAIWFIFGLILSGMSLSGFLMWYKRVVHNRRSTNATMVSHHRAGKEVVS
ncbi:PepSY domain-containing protein [Aestuariibacter halophilus]|uniref:PepSY domain-containing protein n=1 Tax=Fluctibacter halophilus TaxID=226011 RepID=A0ABS8G4B5_9ALTE|nr:PepSY-associated TM helix domain-containing protein [Aestuariibacter halophilus]MCC2615323.1 PepSY domain-containing protein [Aestuariibacter halophilus]